ncbi:MAG: hypothetical protein QM651_14735 [Rhodoblastus sp.]
MSLLPRNISELVNSEKRFVQRPIWDSKLDPRFHVFTAALLVPDDPTAGLEMRAKFSKQFVDRDCLLQLEFTRGGRDRTELARAQWRPFETHTNRQWGPPGYEGARFYRQSHLHGFEHNFVVDERRMRSGSLPAAVPIDPDPSTLSEFLAFFGNRFRIINITDVQLPGASADLFWVKA